jgi:hypothetical protein
VETALAKLVRIFRLRTFLAAVAEYLNEAGNHFFTSPRGKQWRSYCERRIRMTSNPASLLCRPPAARWPHRLYFLVLLVSILLVALAGCDGGGEEPSSKSPEETAAGTSASTIERLPWPAPTLIRLLGKWDQEGQRVVVWFKPDGSFTIGDLENPFAVGTYELDGSTITFTTNNERECIAQWIWEVGLDRSASEDLLRVLVTTGACGAVAGEQWTFARVG